MTPGGHQAPWRRSQVSSIVRGRDATAPAALILGLSQLGAPFKGGVLVPDPDVVIPVTTDVLGQITLASVWPGGVPSGFSFFCQWWIPNVGGATNWAATNGLMGETP